MVYIETLPVLCVYGRMCVWMYVYVYVYVYVHTVYVYVYMYMYELHVNLNRISVGSYIAVRISVRFEPYGNGLDIGCLLGLFYHPL